MTNYSRSVLKSNGPHHSKNLPVKFDFSPIDTSATIAKKLPPQRCFKPLLIPIFNFTHKRPAFAFTGESGYTLGFAQRIAHNGSHAETGGVSDGGWYHYSRSVPHVHQHPRAGYQNGVLCRFGILAGRCSRRTQKAFGTAMRLCVSLSRGVAAPLGCVIFFASAEVAACMPCSRYFFRSSRRSSLCRFCASCVSARSFSARSSMVFGRNRQDFLL